MDRANVEEFYEVYKGVVSEYKVSMELGGRGGKSTKNYFCLKP